jgi:diguanylate cyclase (GGDEF)-like protein
MSKSHAKLVLRAGDVSIIDLESTNRTVVNGQILPPLTPHSLTNNDQIKTGNVIFKFLEKGNIETVSAAQTFTRSVTDSLTGCYNKGALAAHGVEAFKKSALLGVPLSVITFDIDFFSQVNNTYGHPAGDYVLKELTTIIREKLIRENDFFARSGGEEFTLVLLGGHVKQAEEVAGRIRSTIENHEFVFQGRQIPITMSLGVATREPSDSSWLDIFDRADKALYTSKNGGRNKVTVFA